MTGGRWWRWRGVVGVLAVAALARCGGAAEAGKEDLPGEAASAGAAPLEALAPGATQWLRHPLLSGFTTPVSVAQDEDRNVVVLANVEGTADFGGGTLDSRGQWLIVLAKYSPEGALLWARGFPASDVGPGPATALAVDKRRNILVAGRSPGAIAFGGVTTAPGTFLVKLDGLGRGLWAQTFAGTSVPARVDRLAADGDGNIGLVATVDGTLHWSGGTVTVHDQPLLVKLRPDGGFVWAYVEVVPGFATGLVVDTAGSFYVCGSADTALNEGFLWKVSASGKLLWAKNLGQMGGGPQSVATHGNRVVVVGSFALPLSFKGHTVTPDGQDAFAIAFTTDGQASWLRHFGTAGTAIAADQRDGITLIGTYSPGDDLGTGPLPGNPAFNAFITKLDRLDGHTRWVRAIDQVINPEAVSASRERGEVVWLGSFSADVTVGGVPVVAGAAPDFLLMKLAP